MFVGKMSRFKIMILAILFSFSLVVSHYATSYIYFFYASLTWIIIYVISLTRKRHYTSILTGGLILFFAVLVVTWYMYMASSKTFDEVVGIGNYIVKNISDLLIGGSRELTILKLFGLSEPAHVIGANVYRITQFLIIIGVGVLIFRYRQLKFQFEYLIMTLLSLLLLFMCLVLPYFAEFLHVDRFYHITLLFLSPLFILGGTSLFKWILWLFTAIKIRINKARGVLGFHETQKDPLGSPLYLKLLAIIILVPYFLFTSGFIYQVTVDKIPTSIALGEENFSDNPLDEVVVQYNTGYSYETNVLSARWLDMYRNTAGRIYSDRVSDIWILVSYSHFMGAYYIYPDSQIPDNSYIYLSRLNVIRGIVNVPVETDRYGMYDVYNYKTSEISGFLNTRIYTNGESEIYLYK